MKILSCLAIVLCSLAGFIDSAVAADYALAPGADDQKWLLPKTPPSPADNQPSEARIELGKALFFDPRLSSDGNLSCATCHSPMFGWSDGLPTSIGAKSKPMKRASQTLVNTGYNTLMMWDGRKASLEDQVMGPMVSADIMAMPSTLFVWLNVEPTYKAMFLKAYPGEAIDGKTLSKAIAAFERTLISSDSPFDRWVRGDQKAMTKQQITGFRLFSDPAKGNCTACHQAPNFTDGGFHNIGVASYDNPSPDVGRFAIKHLPSLKGAFKTPTLRDIALLTHYFHDGSVGTLEEVVEHYDRGGVSKTDLSPNIKPLHLSNDEKEAIVAFMYTLTTPPKPFVLPQLPIDLHYPVKAVPSKSGEPIAEH